MDKNYFVAPDGNAPKRIRGLLSELTNLILAHLDEGKDISEVEIFLETLFSEPWYQQVEPDQLTSQLHHDLQAACNYWEENWRYEVCWPVLESQTLKC